MKKKKKVQTEPKIRKVHFPLAAFLIFSASIVFALSSQMEEIYILTGSRNPISFIGFILVFAILSTFILGFSGWNPKRDINQLYSLFFGTSLLLIVVILRSISPTLYEKFDLTYLLIAPALIAGIVIIFNIYSLKKAALPALFALLAWPTLLVQGHALLAEPLIAITAFFVKLVSGIANVPLIETDSANHVFEVTSNGFIATIGSTCSGTSSFFAILVLSVPLLFFLRGAWWKKALWIVLGLILAIIGNIARTFLIFYIAHTSGAEAALNWFHQTAGLALFFFVFTVQILLIFAVQLKFTIPPLPKISRRLSNELAIRSMLFASLMIILAFLTIQNPYTEQEQTIRSIEPPQEKEDELDFDEDEIREEEEQARQAEKNAELLKENPTETQETQSRALEDIPKAPEKEFDSQMLNANTTRQFIITKEEPFSYIPPLGGYELNLNTFDFASQLFGPTAEYHRFKYKKGEEPTFFVDVIVTDDSNSLLGLASGYCYRYHNYQILHEEKINVKDDVLAIFYSYIDNKGLNWESIDFITPVIDQDTGKTYYRKIRVIREVRYDLGQDFDSTRQLIELFTYQLFDSLFFTRSE